MKSIYRVSKKHTLRIAVLPSNPVLQNGNSDSAFFGDTKYFIHSPFLINHIPPPSFEISDTCHRAKLDHNNSPFIKVMICCIIHYVL